MGTKTREHSRTTIGIERAEPPQRLRCYAFLTCVRRRFSGAIVVLAWLMLSSLLLEGCRSSRDSEASRVQYVPMPTPGASVGSGGEVVAGPGVVPLDEGSSTVTTKCRGEVRAVNLDAYRVRYDPTDPARSDLVFVTTKPAEAFLDYPGSPETTRPPSITTYARFTLYPTSDPAVGLARGHLEWLVSGMDWDKPGATQNVELYSLNFNPGSTVLFGDRNYEYPLLRGFRVQGEGVRFVHPSGPGAGTPAMEALLKSRRKAVSDAPQSRWHTVSDAPGVELLGDTKLIRAE